MSLKLAAAGVGALLVLVLAGATAIIRESESRDDPVDETSEPSTDAEKRAARVAVEFASRLGEADAAQACALLRGRAARAFTCGQRPQVPAEFRPSAEQRTFEVFDVIAPRHGGETSVVISIERAPTDSTAMAVEVDAAGRIVDVVGVGYG
jgi:hypothetical protein